jgi:flagellar motor switch protein FliM
MSTADILSQDEIDALLGGMSDGDVDTGVDNELEDGDVRSYDFTSQDRIVRGRMPTLEMVNERFARNLRVSLFNLLRRSPEISVGNVQLLKYADYVQGLFMPANMNLVKCKPLRGTALFTLDPKLIFGIVDSYFGGSGLFHAKIEGRDFTPTELRVVALVLERVFDDLTQAWKAVLPMEFLKVRSEVNPHLANIVSPSEIIVVTVFNVELEGGGGELHIAMPYTMVEPIRELLDAGVQSDRSDQDEHWVRSLREEIETAELELCTSLTQFELPLRRLRDLKPGDVIPIEMPETVVGTVEEVPVLRARFGCTRTSLALKVMEMITHPSKQSRTLFEPETSHNG